MKKLLEEEIEVVVELWLSLDVLSFKPAWRPGQKHHSLILALTLLAGPFDIAATHLSLTSSISIGDLIFLMEHFL